MPDLPSSLKVNPLLNGIPIMPGAIAGEGDEESYVFISKALSQQVQEYYELELIKAGSHLRRMMGIHPQC